MIINGNCRSDGVQAGIYITSPGENERVEVLEQYFDYGHDQKSNVRMAVMDFDLWSKSTLGEKGLYHAQINPHPDFDGMTPELWKHCADHLEKKLGLEGQPRVMTLHVKNGREHAHVIWARTDLENNKLINISYSRLKQKEAGKELSHELYPEIEINRMPSKGKSYDLTEYQIHKRLNLNVQERRKAIAEDWEQSRDGETLKKRFEGRGYILAKGDRRGFVLVDMDGNPHNPVQDLNKTLKVKVKEFREKVGEIADNLPSVAEAQEIQAERRRKRETRHEKNAESWIDRQKDYHKKERDDLKKKHREERKEKQSEIKAFRDKNRPSNLKKAFQNLHAYDLQRENYKEKRLEQERKAHLQERIVRNRQNELDPYDQKNRETHSLDKERTDFLSEHYQKARLAVEEKTMLERRIKSFERRTGNATQDFEKIYRNPKKAREAFKNFVAEHGAGKTAREINARPETFGKLRGSQFTQTKAGKFLREKLAISGKTEREEAIQHTRKASQKLDRMIQRNGQDKWALEKSSKELENFSKNDRPERLALLADIASAAKGLNREEWRELDDWQKYHVKFARESVRSLSKEQLQELKAHRQKSFELSPVEHKQAQEMQDLRKRQQEERRKVQEREGKATKRQVEKEKEQERGRMIKTLEREIEQNRGKSRERSRSRSPGEG